MRPPYRLFACRGHSIQDLPPVNGLKCAAQCVVLFQTAVYSMQLKTAVGPARNRQFPGKLRGVLARPRRQQFDPLGTKYFVQARDEGILLQVA